MTSPSRRLAAVGFAEVPDFHIAILRRASPELVDRPLLIGGDPAKRGKVVSASGDLRARGIVVGMGMIEALDRAPEAKCVRTDLQHAREVSGLLRAAIRREVDAVEIDGLAGFYFRAPSDPAEAGRLLARLESQVARRTGLSLRLGVAPARFAARIAAEDAGDQGATVIAADRFEAYLRSQPVDRLPGVGPKTAARLAELGAAHIPGLRALGMERLEILLGKQGRSLWLLASGQDPKPLRLRRHPATLSREETLAEPVPSALGSGVAVEGDPILESLSRIAAGLESALRRDGLGARRIALRLTYLAGRTVTRSCSLDSATSEAAKLVAIAQGLLGRVADEGGLIRRVGLILKGLGISGAEDRQLDLF